MELGKTNEKIVKNLNVSNTIRNIELGGKMYAIEGIPYFIIAYTGVEKDAIKNYLKTYKEKFQGIINLEKKYAYIDSRYFWAMGHSSLACFGELTEDKRYVVIEGDDILKYFYFMLNSIFMTKDINKEMILNDYFEYYHFKKFNND
ncbi:hypothetical protein [Fusobacterium varium]